MAKQIMKEFEIDEISAVDRPAQGGAKATIMKRHSREHDTTKRAVLTTATDGHTHLVQTYESMSGDTSWVNDHSHPWILSENGIITLGEAVGHTHGIDELTMTKEVATPAETETAEMTTKDDKAVDVEAVAKANEAESEALVARAERAEKVATLNDAQKALFSKMDTEAQDAYLALDADGRQAEVTKAQDANAVVFTALDGTEYRKNDDPRLIKMAKSADEERTKRIDTEAKAKQADLEKRAAELEHIPGDLNVRVALLKGIESLPEADQAPALEALKAQDAALGVAFKRVGTAGTPTEADPLDAIAKRLRDEDPKLTPEAAMAKALTTPEGEAAYAKSVGL